MDNLVTSHKSAIRWLVLTLCITLWLAFTSPAFAQDGGQVLAAQASSVCQNSDIPTGWVVTSVSTATNNPCYPLAQYQIAQPTGQTFPACFITSTPAGWTVTHISNFGNPCGSNQPETLTKVSGSSMSVCSNDPANNVPPGWAITAVSAPGGACDNYQVWVVRVISGTSMSVCANTPIPSGWVVTQVTATNGPCANNQGYTIQVLTGTTASICSATNQVPQGWLVISVTGSGNITCQNFEQFTVSQLSGTDMSGCWVGSANLPSYWVVESISNHGSVSCVNFQNMTVHHLGVYETTAVVCDGATQVPSDWMVTGILNGASTCTQNLTETIAPKFGPSIPAIDRVLLAAHNPNTGLGAVPADLNQDGLSDLLFFNSSTSQLQYFLTGSTSGNYSVAASRIVNITPGYSVRAVGRTGLFWTSANNDLYAWAPSRVGGDIEFSSSYIGTYPAGWTLIGAGSSGLGSDSDLLWIDDNTCQYGWWPMNGVQQLGAHAYALPSCGTHIVAIGYFAGGTSSSDLLVVTGGNYAELQLWTQNPAYGAIQGDGYAHLSLGRVPSGKFVGAASAANLSSPTVYFRQSGGATGTQLAQYAIQLNGVASALVQGATYATTASDYIAQIGGTYDGSGNQSLMWANDGTHTLNIWEQNGGGPTNLNFVTHPTNSSYSSGFTAIGGAQ